MEPRDEGWRLQASEDNRLLQQTMQTINLNEDQREKFGEMQVQFQGLRKQLSSVVAQVIRWRSMLALRAHSRGSHREKNKVVLLMSDGTVRASTIESASARGRETACYFLGGGHSL